VSDLFARLEFSWELEAACERPFSLNGFDDSREADVGIDLVSQLSGQTEKRRLEMVSESAWFRC